MAKYLQHRERERERERERACLCSTAWKEKVCVCALGCIFVYNVCMNMCVGGYGYVCCS